MKRRISATTLTFLAALGACSDLGEPADVSDEVEAAKQAFVSFQFYRARDIFAEALARNPEHAEAAYGYARTLVVLHQIEEARPALERAIELAPDDPRPHESYVSTLSAGGVFFGRRDWLERALEVGPEALRAFPDRVGLYRLVQRTAEDLNQPERWAQILDALEPEIGSSPVFRIHHTGARLSRARSAGDGGQVASIEEALREDLALAAAADAEAVAAGITADPGRRYFLAMGHSLLEESEQERRWLTRLDETPEGRRMGDLQVAFVFHFPEFWETREASFEARQQVIERWKARYPPAWDAADYQPYLAPLRAELDMLLEEASAQHHDGGHPSSELLNRIVAVADTVVRLETYGWANQAREKVAQTLVELDARLDEALRIAEEGITALEERRAGVLYPGLREDEVEAERENQIADLELLRGKALRGMDRPAEAEQAIRRAIQLSPRSDRFAALGELLAEEGRPEEAFETLVTALAHNSDDEQMKDDAGRLRGLALAAAEASGRDENTLDRHLDARRTEVMAEARFRLVTDRLDEEAPDFELTDTEGTEWSLSGLRGKVVVLNFWATWCGPCRRELPHYQELVDEYAEADDVVFLAISTDVEQSVPRDFLDENGYRFTVLFDEGMSTDYHVTGIPTHFILGPEGRIQYITGGLENPQSYLEGMRARIEALRTD